MSTTVSRSALQSPDATAAEAALPTADRGDTPTTSPSVQLSGHALTLGYRTGPVVHGADVTVRPGEVTALVGPNGSGKSTLLRGLARLHDLEAGTIRVTDGSSEQIDARTLTRRSFATRVALLTQQRPVPDGITVRDVVAFGRSPHQRRFRRQDPDGPAVIERSMAATGVADLAQRRVDELSGGQVQRVWLASCLAQDTGVLLLDEPTNHLDLRYQAEMLDLIGDLAATGIAVGVVLHDLDHAAEVAHRITLVHQGRVAAEGPPAQVLTEDLLSEVYEVPITVHVDPVSGVLTTRPRRRRSAPQRSADR